MQADPLGLVDGASVYGYAGQNPGRYTDPTGECIGPWAIACAGAAAGAFNVAVGFYIDKYFGDDCYTLGELSYDFTIGFALGGLGRAWSAAGAGWRYGAAAGAGWRAGAAAGAAAEGAATAGATRGAAAAVASRSGNIYTGLSKHAASQAGQGIRPLNKVIEKLAESCGGNGSGCAEVQAISKLIAAEGWGALEGSFIAAARVGSKKAGDFTGKAISPCPSCSKWLTNLGIKF